MQRLHIDLETFSSTDLAQCGVVAYATDPTAEVLICAYAFGNDPVQVWLPGKDPVPEEFKEALLSPDYVKIAFNIGFEKTCLKEILGLDVPTEQWFDTQLLARQCGLPATLEKAAEASGIEAQKDAKGKALIRKFSVPRAPTKRLKHTRVFPEDAPELFEDFISYCVQDVEVERSLFKRLRRMNIPSERKIWLLDRKINERGIPIDVNLTEAIDDLYTTVREKKLVNMNGVTGLENSGSRDQLLGWLRANGYPYSNLKATSMEKALMYENDMTAIAKEVLAEKVAISVSSAAKFKAVLRANIRGRVYNAFAYYGASRTGRWAGRVYQPQNLPRPDKKISQNLDEVIADVARLSPDEFVTKWDLPAVARTLTRSIVRSYRGKFAVADLSSIENVVLGWLAEEPEIIETFRNGLDPYKTFAVHLFGVDYDDVTKEQRTLAKPPVLGCGYRLGGGGWREDEKSGEPVPYGLLGYAKGFGVDWSEDQCHEAVSLWREKHPQVVSFWKKLEKAAFKAIRTKAVQQVGKLTFQMNGPFLEIVLPSGRPLRYYQPEIKMVKTPWGEERPAVTFLAAQYGMSRISTHGGKLTENVVQAVARDVLAHGMLLADEKGLEIVLHVHDEIVVDSENPEEDLETLTRCMTTMPEWGDDDLILRADGFITERYAKD
jgi:DNA polymerase